MGEKGKIRKRGRKKKRVYSYQMWNCKVLWCPADGVHQVTSGDISGMQFIWTIIMLFFDGGRGMNFETKSKVVYCIFGGENGVWKRVHTVHVLSGG